MDGSLKKRDSLCVCVFGHTHSNLGALHVAPAERQSADGVSVCNEINSFLFFLRGQISGRLRQRGTVIFSAPLWISSPQPDSNLSLSSFVTPPSNLVSGHGPWLITV